MLIESARFILGHTGYALAMALIFGAGAVFSFPVMRWQVRPLLFFPKWFARTLERFMAAAPSRGRLALFIFSFNGSVMLLYMLTGFVPGMPALVAFMTGLNVMLAGFMGRSKVLSQKTVKPLSLSARVCAVLTFCLELPCFWYTMAMGWTMESRLSHVWRSAGMASAQERIVTYAMIILPLLMISALAEAHAVVSAFGEHGPEQAE